jgi:two-component system, response regulator
MILLVDDNEDEIELARRAFARASPEVAVAVARDGQQALDYLFAASERASIDPAAMPRVVLLDLNMPGLSGLDVLRRLRADERTRRLPVVVLSSSAQMSDITRCYDQGANSYVRKPVDFARFVETAHHLHAYWVDVNESPLHAPAH